MMHEQEAVTEREPTVEGILDALRSGDRLEGRRLWDEWEQLKIRENDGVPTSEKRLAIAVESLGLHLAAGEDADVMAFEHFTVIDAIGSDGSLSEDKRRALLDRLAQVMGKEL